MFTNLILSKEIAGVSQVLHSFREILVQMSLGDMKTTGIEKIGNIPTCESSFKQWH